MRTLFDSVALVVGGAGLVALGLAVVVGRSWRGGLAFALDMWTAGGLLLLAGEAAGPGWDRIAAAAAIVAVRALVGPWSTSRRRGQGGPGSNGPGSTGPGSRRRGPLSGRTAQPPMAGGR